MFKYKFLLFFTLLGIAFLLSGCFNKKTVAPDESSNSASIQEVADNKFNKEYKVEIDKDNKNANNSNAITLADIASHDSADDCWFAIDGKVYDVTEYIDDDKHPGGAAMLAGCGLDATELFATRPMGSGTEHSDEAYAYKENFYIGDLAN